MAAAKVDATIAQMANDAINNVPQRGGSKTNWIVVEKSTNDIVLSFWATGAQEAARIISGYLLVMNASANQVTVRYTDKNNK